MEFLEALVIFILGMLVDDIIRRVRGVKSPHNKSIHVRLKEIENESCVDKSN